jgi:predicted O-methyltransferase YrrM
VDQQNSLYNRAVRRFSRLTFTFWERLGFHIVPIHFYQPIPDSRTLSPSLSERTSDLVGIDINDSFQLDLLDRFEKQFRAEYDSLPRSATNDPTQFHLDNTAFSTIDAEILYCMIRQFHPRRIIEIGSGNSTLLSAQALRENAKRDGVSGELISIEPYPNSTLQRGVPGLTQLIHSKVQQIPLERFASLEANDILFIDSSHITQIDSDVNYEFLEILPRIKPGVIVHIHDIYLPREYDLAMFNRHKTFGLNEQYVLHAFLAFNKEFEILWASNYMCVTHPKEIERAFRSYSEHLSPAVPGSFWIRRTSNQAGASSELRAS